MTAEPLVFVTVIAGLSGARTSEPAPVLVIGPPESISKVRTILDRLDRRPQQVYLSTVIGQLQLNNNFELGVDWVQTFKKISGSSGIASAIAV